MGVHRRGGGEEEEEEGWGNGAVKSFFAHCLFDKQWQQCPSPAGLLASADLLLASPSGTFALGPNFASLFRCNPRGAQTSAMVTSG